MGLSVLPPPATTPIVALQSPLMVFLHPEGNLNLVLAPSSECPIIVAYVPDALEKAPLSPTFSSTLQTTVPSGILLIGRTFPTAISAFKPQYTYCPEYYPSAAMKYSLLCLYL